MKALVLKEFKSVFCSSSGVFFACAFFLIMGVMLWAFPGRYNIIDNGYAGMSFFFVIAPILLAVFIPALTMRLFSEEKRNKTLDVLRSRPVSVGMIYLSKFLAPFVFIIVVLLFTSIYVYSLWQLAYPVGNIDIAAIVASYVSLILLSAVFVVVGQFGSAITKNQVVALIISVFLCFFILYGFELFSSFFLSGKIQIEIASLGLLHHYKQMQRGVIQIENVRCIINYLILFICLALLYLSQEKKRIIIYSSIYLLVFNILFLFVSNVRFDFTTDKRYTLSDYSKRILESVGKREPLEINIYLTGELNSGFQHLQNATSDLLSDLNQYADNTISVKYINPYQENKSLEEMYNILYSKGMTGIMLNEVDREGKVSRKMIFPYAQVTNKKDTLVVPLLKNIVGNNAEENINASIESLEFEFIDAMRLLNQEKAISIAFIEGHDELSRVYLYDAEELLSKYYTINRGEIGKEIGVLDDFDAVIIAGPLTKFTETEKYIIDQYIMNGGKVLWMIDGVYYSHQDLLTKGQSASMKNELHLDDMLFNYGVRINADLIQDKQCVSTYLVTNEQQASTLVPSFLQPLLIPSPNHPVTKDIRDVKAGFASSIDIVNNSAEIKKEILLTSSANTHLLRVPDLIDFDIERIQNMADYFNSQYIPVAVSLEGSFNSAFLNRMIPDDIDAKDYKPVNKSEETKMIIVSSSDIISNEVKGQGDDTQVLPMGYDRVSQQQFGNREFIVNAISWLTDDDGLMNLRIKQQQLYILNKKEAIENRDKYAVLNIVLPISLIILLIGSIFAYRKRKYEK
ncbi:gliding motility-associated ABC transporter substrate-binding protein GldG [Dysgonomonas sp. Marseille-P4677]|uniref:gliding motility-associated ABC transporter substrate-binding protein GldG n=1 Tax=Dysgonomonas sp. Marseille-P4677 TaxID=2364790 RepID=UPI001912951A|nr:gliding motility-associated ABC transporter substrate-binding protein GldG [Dysgonomonas sp. Marseille-P4677]MBK5722462.1 gliding motility-associated ABC transporter substrate-binding protein GldG [Dysgonomonas sp. Marseille-P4677]